MERGEAIKRADWTGALLDLPSEVALILEKGNLIYEKQCFVFRDLVHSVAQYAEQWTVRHDKVILAVASLGEELIRVLERGMELVSFCAGKTSPGVIFVILGSLGEFREIIDDVRRYSQMLNQYSQMLKQYSQIFPDAFFCGDELKPIELDSKALQRSLECAFEGDKLAFSTLEKEFNEDNLSSQTTRRASKFKWIYRIFTGSSENTALNRVVSTGSSENTALNRVFSLLKRGVLPTIDINDLSFQSRLGRGSFGEVEKFLWCGAIPVAVKEFHYSSDFEDELNVYRKMTPDDSPHLVQILGHYVTKIGRKEIGHLVLELMETNLENVMEENELTILQSVDILLQIAKAMKCLHAKDIIYRDLKPANILLNRNKDNKSFQIKLADFGISAANFGTGRHTGFRGTIFYMAPEVMKYEGAKYSRKVDVYSFGVVCSQIITSTLTDTLVSRIRNESYETVEQIRDELKQKSLKMGIPDRLQRLIVNCWNKDDNARPNFKQICEELWGVKESLLFEKDTKEEKSCMQLILNREMKLGITEDYYNFAVCGDRGEGPTGLSYGKNPKREFVNRFLFDKYTKWVSVSETDIKSFTNPKLRPHVALWTLPDWTLPEYPPHPFDDGLLVAFDCILIFIGNSTYKLHIYKRAALKSKLRNRNVAVVLDADVLVASDLIACDRKPESFVEMEKFCGLADIPLFYMSRNTGRSIPSEYNAPLLNFILDCVKSRF